MPTRAERRRPPYGSVRIHAGAKGRAPARDQNLALFPPAGPMTWAGAGGEATSPPAHRPDLPLQDLPMPLISRVLTLAVLAFSAACAGEVDPFDQSKVPLEVDTSDPALTKIVLVAGQASHGPGEHEFYAGCALLMDMLKQTPGVFPVMARDGWPKNEKIFEGAKAVVFYMDGGGGHPVIQPKHKE